MAIPERAKTQSRPAEPETTVRVRAVSLEPPSKLAPRLREMLAGCDGWTRNRSGGIGFLHLQIESRASGVAELYSGLVGCGLELDRRSHHDLTVLCTLAHETGLAEMPGRMLDLRLEIVFTEVLYPADPGVCAALA